LKIRSKNNNNIFNIYILFLKIKNDDLENFYSIYISELNFIIYFLFHTIYQPF
jgi:hypothetical protein